MGHESIIKSIIKIPSEITFDVFSSPVVMVESEDDGIETFPVSTSCNLNKSPNIIYG